MTSPWGVTPEYIAQAATDSHQVAADVKSDLATLQSYIEGLGAEWLGLASTTFQAVMTDFQAYARVLYDALDEIGNGLQGNFSNYVNVESDIQAQLNQVQLNGPVDGFVPPTLQPIPVGSTVAPGDVTWNP